MQSVFFVRVGGGGVEGWVESGLVTILSRLSVLRDSAVHRIVENNYLNRFVYTTVLTSLCHVIGSYF